MLSKRDYDLKDFLEDFEVASTSQIRQLYFKNVSLRYCQIRLNKLAEYNEIKRFRNHIDQEYLYCITEPRQVQHFWLRTKLYFECMKYYKIHEWVNRLQVGKVEPDAYMELVDHGIIFGIFVEIHRSNNVFNQAKYENLYLSGTWRDKYKSFPRVLIVTDKKVKLQPSKIKFKIIDTRFNGLDKIFL